ncbi:MULTISPECIES: hypothetical protein [Franconibacter]|uniref:protein YnhH n=1 Tax=Franconibacter TaxID=1649295 RepID=UPI003AF30C6C
MNGFSALDCHNNYNQIRSSRLAEAQAHFPLHAWLMSPILIRLWHYRVSDTGSQATAKRAAVTHFSYPSSTKRLRLS